MKYYESTFEDYINAISKKNIHPHLSDINNYTSNEVQKTKNLIFYGPSKKNALAVSANFPIPDSDSRAPQQ